jgi:hypothetical protein
MSAAADPSLRTPLKKTTYIVKKGGKKFSFTNLGKIQFCTSEIATYPANVSKFFEQIYVGCPGIIVFISKPCDKKRLLHLENGHQLEITTKKLTSTLQEQLILHLIQTSRNIFYEHTH